MMLQEQLCYCETPSKNSFSVGVSNIINGKVESHTVSNARMSVNTDSLEQFLKDVEKRAYRMAYIATSNVDDALDIVQDAMMILASKYASRSKEEWAPLFFRVLQNKIRDHYRRQKVRNVFQNWFSSDDDENNEDPIQMLEDEAVHDPIRKISGEKEIERLEQAIQTLPLRQQQTFLLRAWEGLDVKQTAKAMEITTGSVKTHYSRALQALRSKISEVGYEK